MLVLTSACSDHLFDDLIDNGDTDSEGIGFGTYVTEQADQLYAMGQTRTAAGQTALDSTSEAVLTATSRPMQSNTLDTRLYLHRKALPLMGIHPGTVRTQSSTTTRAASSDIVPTGSDPINFHDSLTIWGSVYDESGNKHRLLFHQTLLKKVRGFRSSVHWPYKNTTNLKSDNKEETVAEWNGKWMNFCALAPAYESLEDMTVNEPAVLLKDDVNAHPDLPTFTYKIPEDPRQQRDLLFGISDNIDVQAGPSALGYSEQYPYADTEKEQHLGQDDKVIPMTFRHILTTVRFAQGKMPTTVGITKVELHNILNTGTFTPTPGAALPGTWGDLGSSKSDYDVFPNYTAETFAGGENVYLTDSVLFLMPHTLTSAAKLHVTLKDASNKEHTLSCSLEGDVWLPGYTVTYVITIGEVADNYYLFVDPNAATGQATHDSNAAQTSSFTIHSYHNFINYANSAVGESVKYAAPWVVTGFGLSKSDGSQPDVYTTAKPAWLTDIDGWNSSSSVPEEAVGGQSVSLGYSLAKQEWTFTINHATMLEYNSDRASMSGTIDLSTRVPNASTNWTTVNQRTANCYIVNAAGGYEFPAVYGNAIENGITKTGATLNPGNVFLDHEGVAINDAWIYKQTERNITHHIGDPIIVNGTTGNIKTETTKYTSFTPVLLWKDTANDIFTIDGYDVSNYVKFTVNKTGITPCNAIIGLKGTTKTTTYVLDVDNGYGGTTEQTETKNETADDLLWAWHIWVTDEVYPNEPTQDITIDGVNIKGDVLYPTYNADTDSKIVSLENFAGTKTNILPVNLGWVPKELNWGVYKPRDCWVEIAQRKKSGSDETTGNTIHLRIRQEAYPDLIEGTSTIYQWGSPVAHPMATPATGDDIAWNKSWWGASAVNTAFWSTTGKTLYDPCPPGYQLPAGTVFTGFSLTGDNITNTNSGANLNVWNNGYNNRYAELKKGAWVYTTKHTTLTDADRYSPMVYIPASGTWNSVGNSSDESTSFLWTGSYSGTNGINVRLRPQKGSSSTNQDFFLYDEATFPFTIAMPIRPVSSQ